MGRGEIGYGLLAALDGIEKVPDVGLKLVADLVVAFVLDRFRPISDRAWIDSRLREARNLRFRCQRLVGGDLEPAPIDAECSLGPIDLEAAPAAAGDFTARPAGEKRRVLENRIEHVRRLTEAAQRPALCKGGKPRWNLTADPLDDVDLVRQEVRRLATRVVVEPAEVVEAARRIEGHFRRGPEPQVPLLG